MASQASRNVRERVLPAPKTPAIASVDLSERSASAKLEANAVMWPLSVRRTECFGKVSCLRTIRERITRGKKRKQ